jgi:hypothetical protein
MDTFGQSKKGVLGVLPDGAVSLFFLGITLSPANAIYAC